MARIRQIIELPDSIQKVLDKSRHPESRKLPPHQRYQQGEGAHVSTIITTEEQVRFWGTDVESDTSTRTRITKGLSADIMERREDRGYNVIECWINPAAINWSAPQRGALQKVQSGSILYLSPRKRGKSRTYFDEVTANITFQTGSIYTRAGGEMDGEVPPGLNDFYRFLKLLNEPKLLSNGEPNLHVAIHTSRVFPDIVLKGWFTPEGVSWPESAEGGNSLQWTATMEVQKTIPALWDLDGLERMFGTVRE